VGITNGRYSASALHYQTQASKYISKKIRNFIENTLSAAQIDEEKRYKSK